VRYLVTGHTGFKGSWLTLLLTQRGDEVCGIALDPEPGSLFERARLDERLAADMRVDIRDGEATCAAIADAAPDMVIHMAAQPLVRASYADPRWTMETNVMGTLSVLEGVRQTPSVRGAVMVTTDKVYRNVGRLDGYVESDPLGGHDPYSASKAMADLLISSWVDSFGGCPTATARAGNVIGGGDISADRLLPDLIRGFAAGEPVGVRNPQAVRPWQHVLDCLHGYLLLADAVAAGRGAGAWNFGPDPSGFRTVAETADRAVVAWGAPASWFAIGGEHLHEAALLTLDPTHARQALGWRDRLTFDEAVDWTVKWRRQVDAGESALDVTLDQIAAFDALADARVDG
jgi:CDP-glucose 4,6-dehydratase